MKVCQERWEEDFKMEQLKKRMAREREERDEELRLKEGQIRLEREMREASLKKRSNRLIFFRRSESANSASSPYTTYSPYSEEAFSPISEYSYSGKLMSKWGSAREDIKSSEEEEVSDLKSSSNASFDTGIGDSVASDSEILFPFSRSNGATESSPTPPTSRKDYSERIYHRSQSVPETFNSNSDSKDRFQPNLIANLQFPSYGKNSGMDHVSSSQPVINHKASRTDSPDPKLPSFSSRTESPDPKLPTFSSSPYEPSTFSVYINPGKNGVYNGSASRTHSPVHTDLHSHSTSSLINDELMPNQSFPRETIISGAGNDNGCHEEQTEWEKILLQESERKLLIEESERKMEKIKADEERRAEERRRLEIQNQKMKMECEKIMENQKWVMCFSKFKKTHGNEIEEAYQRCCSRFSEHTIKPDIDAFKLGWYEGFNNASKSI